MTAPLALGRYGVWRNRRQLDLPLARAIEQFGFTSLWVGGSPDLSDVKAILDGTESIVVATGIVNIWSIDPRELAAQYQRIVTEHPDRFILGIGASHPERFGDRAARPIRALTGYLGVLQSHSVPAARTVLAALGPRALRLAAERSAGAHPYFVPPAHTAAAREALGPDRLLAPEQRVVLSDDPASARDLARRSMAGSYLQLTNYRRNLLRLGYTEEELETASDRVVDDLTVWGDDDAVRSGLHAHLDAGADAVLAQVLTGDGEDPVAAHARLAAILGLRAARPVARAD